MDPAWTSCPYCSGSQPAADPSSGSATGSPQPVVQAQGDLPIPPLPGGRKRPPTTPEQQGSLPNPAPPAGGLKPDPASAPSGGRKKTEFGDAASQPLAGPAPSSAPRPAQPGTRRIVALLVTYTWQSQGQVFPVYEGRNYLGRDADCEICLESDTQISGHHSAIFYRGEIFEITDEKSMNGTFVDGKSVPLTGMPLENNALIKTGATTWRFIVIPVTER
jgi:hypothetical protein